MAEVFSGYVLGSHGFQKPVAIKRLLPELANDHIFVERLIGEAKLLVGMQHGNIVSVLDLARDGDDVFLVMEYVDGPSLRQLLKGRGSRLLPLAVASYIVQSAAAGLEFAHAQPGGAIIHADISPSNLLLTTSGEVRVADFGIARREGNGAGVVEGKWAYMAPEQARGEPLTPRSDVFALGVVLYELITGQHPLGRQVSAEERDSGPIRVIPPSVVNPAVPRGLEAICMRALAEKPRDRYARMQQLIDEIVDERFTNQWRAGANDLAQAIREIAPGASSVAINQPRTQVTDRPVTIMTRSLISQTGRTPRPAVATPAQPGTESTEDQITEESYRDSTRLLRRARGSVHQLPAPAPVLVPPSGAQTIDRLRTPPRASVPALVPPPALSPELLDAFRASARQLQSPELASVHGGATVTGSSLIDLRDARSSRWTFAVLGVAALIGVVAAITIQLAPSDELLPAEPRAARAEAPVATSSAEEPAPATRESVEPTVPTVRAQASESAVEPVTIERAAIEPEPKPRKARTAAAPAKRASAAPVADATLRVNTYNAVWAWVFVGSERQEVPHAKFKLPAGTHTVKLRNTDLGVTRICTVTLESGQVRTLKVEMEEGGCELGR